MLSHSCVINFRDHIELYEAISEMGKPEGAADGNALVYRAPFATIRSEVYPLLDCMNLNIFEILPTADIRVPFEFDGDYLEVEYAVNGSFLVQADDCKDGIYLEKHLYISPRSGSKGSIAFCDGKPSKTISFMGNTTAINELFGETGDELWAEAFKPDDGLNRKFPVTPAPPDIAGSFLQIAGCDYPDRVKKLFFESKLREILTRIIAHKTPVEESYSESYAAEQVRKIPGMLMDDIENPPSISELAHRLSMNATTMKCCFKRIFGSPIYAHHRNTCLDLAAAMLLDTDKPVFEIAIDAGYSGSVNFSCAFKRRYGVSPSQYRRWGGLRS